MGESENWNLYEKNETTESKSQCELRILVKISGENDIESSMSEHLRMLSEPLKHSRTICELSPFKHPRIK